MGNNVKEKNLVYGFKSYDNLPYQEYGQIGYIRDNIFVDNVSMNSIYNSMVDNDFALAESILDKKNKYVGPVNISSLNDTATIDNFEHGQKFYTDQTGVNIWRKFNNDLQHSIVKITDTANHVPNGTIVKSFENRVVVGSNDKVFVFEISDMTKANAGQPHPIASYSISNIIGCEGDAQGTALANVFAGKQSNANKIFIFNGNSFVDSGVSVQTNDKIVSMIYRKADNKIFYADKKNIYSVDVVMSEDSSYFSLENNVLLFAFYGNLRNSNISKLLLLESSTDKNVDVGHDILIFTYDNNDQASSTYLTWNGKKLNAGNEQKIVLQNSSIFGTIKDCIQINGYEYYLVSSSTNPGLYIKEPNSSTAYQKYGNHYNALMTCIAQNGYEIWCGFEDGYMFVYNTATKNGKWHYINSNESIVGIEFVFDVPVIATNKRLGYYIDEDDNHNDDFILLDNLSCVDINSQKNGSSNTQIYALGNKNNQSSTALMLNLRKKYAQSNVISGMNDIYSNNETFQSMFYFDSSAYVASNGSTASIYDVKSKSKKYSFSGSGQKIIGTYVSPNKQNLYVFIANSNGNLYKMCVFDQHIASASLTEYLVEQTTSPQNVIDMKISGNDIVLLYGDDLGIFYISYYQLERYSEKTNGYSGKVTLKISRTLGYNHDHGTMLYKDSAQNYYALSGDGKNPLQFEKCHIDTVNEISAIRFIVSDAKKCYKEYGSETYNSTSLTGFYNQISNFTVLPHEFNVTFNNYGESGQLSNYSTGYLRNDLIFDLDDLSENSCVWSVQSFMHQNSSGGYDKMASRIISYDSNIKCIKYFNDGKAALLIPKNGTELSVYQTSKREVIASSSKNIEDMIVSNDKKLKCRIKVKVNQSGSEYHDYIIADAISERGSKDEKVNIICSIKFLPNSSSEQPYYRTYRLDTKRKLTSSAWPSVIQIEANLKNQLVAYVDSSESTNDNLGLTYMLKNPDSTLSCIYGIQNGSNHDGYLGTLYFNDVNLSGKVQLSSNYQNLKSLYSTWIPNNAEQIYPSIDQEILKYDSPWGTDNWKSIWKQIDNATVAYNEHSLANNCTECVHGIAQSKIYPIWNYQGADKDKYAEKPFYNTINESVLMGYAWSYCSDISANQRLALNLFQRNDIASKGSPLEFLKTNSNINTLSYGKTLLEDGAKNPFGQSDLIQYIKSGYDCDGNFWALRSGTGNSQIDIIGKTAISLGSNASDFAMFSPTSYYWWKDHIFKTMIDGKLSTFTDSDMISAYTLKYICKNNDDNRCPYFLIDDNDNTSIQTFKYLDSKELTCDVSGNAILENDPIAYKIIPQNGSVYDCFALAGNQKDQYRLTKIHSVNSGSTYEDFYVDSEKQYKEIISPNNMAYQSENPGNSYFISSNGVSGLVNLINYPTDPDTFDSNDFTVQGIDITYMSYEDGKCWIYYSIPTGKNRGTYKTQIFGMQNNGMTIKQTNWMPYEDFQSIKHAIRIDKNNYILASDYYAYLYYYVFDKANQQHLDVGVKTLGDGTRKIGALAYSDSIDNRYIATLSNDVMQSNDGLSWNKQFSFDSQNIGFMPFNKNSFIAGLSSSTTGCYCYSRYSYVVVCDTPQLDSISAYAIYQKNESYISSTISDSIQNHIEEMHENEYGYDTINEYMPTQLSIPDSFTTSSLVTIDGKKAAKTITGDYIYRFIYGDNSDGFITAKIKNTITNSKWQGGVKLNYIAKCWKSGIIELFIYIESTKTYYIPRVPGAGYQPIDGILPMVNGKQLASTSIADNFTAIQLDIDSSYFNIDYVYENTIKGNSLPLGIFKDFDFYDAEGDITELFRSFVQPSIAGQFGKASSTLDTDQSTYYYCFGSDAQAIKIMAYDSKKNYNKKAKKVIYHGNSGYILGTNDINTKTQRFIEPETEAEQNIVLLWDIFYNEGGIFLGWSRTLNSKQPDYQNKGSTINYYDDIVGDELHLYACWTFYAFDGNETQIIISNNAPQNYTIAEVTIDRNANLGTNNSDVKLDNRLIVNFGED